MSSCSSLNAKTLLSQTQRSKQEKHGRDRVFVAKDVFRSHL